MKFFFDNNLPPALAKAMNELCKAHGGEVVHLRDRFSANTPDIEWVKILKDEGDWIIISQDLFRKGKLEKEAFYSSNLLAFIFAGGWTDLDYWTKAAKMVAIWPSIMEQTKLLSGGGVFEVPVKGKKFHQVKL